MTDLQQIEKFAQKNGISHLLEITYNKDKGFKMKKENNLITPLDTKIHELQILINKINENYNNSNTTIN
jgi:hypothetical protein